MTARSLFLQALTKPADQRTAFLDAVCQGQHELRAEVERLLAEHQQRSSDIDTSSAFAPDDSATGAYVPSIADEPNKTTATPSGDPNLGKIIAGRYTLLKIIGEGGMGSVYLAEQTQPVKRQVALKLIKSGFDSQSVVSRFEAERQALALMDHPNIAHVFDGGTTSETDGIGSGNPYFVMELVNGIPLTRYCDQHRLSIKARLELFVSICQAVQHAHQKGIIHRDLKPTNVLVAEVDGRPTPKVIDFGVAKATEWKLTDISFEDAGTVVGTPVYMSPEQADPTTEDIDTRTDVYALGVMLYELMVGSPPIDAKQFKRGAILEMLRMVRENDPPRPSTKLSTAENRPNIAANRCIEPAKLSKLLHGELDWVVMKAIEKDRNRRYESANGLGRDIQRYLTDEVVEARPPSRAYRFAKFVRRNRGSVIAASLVFLALIAGVIGTSVGMVEAKKQGVVAHQNWTRAENERTRAEQNYATARSLILDMGLRINQIETGQADPKLADMARKQALDKAREQFEQFRADVPDDATLQRQTAFLHRYAANVSRLLSDFNGAAAAYSAAIKVYEELIARFPTVSLYRDDLAQTLADRAGAEKRMGKLRESAATLQQALKITDGIQDSFRDSPSYRRSMAVILNDRTDVVYRLGQFDEAATLAAQAGDLFDQLSGLPANQKNTVDPLYAAMTVHRRALAQRELGKTADAMTTHDDAIARMKVLVGPKANRDVRYWDCETRRERAWTAAGIPERRETAADELVDVIRVMEALVAENPQIAFYKESLVAAYLRRGELFLLLNKLELASSALERSMTVSRELLDRFGPLSGSVLVRGQTYLALGKLHAAAGKPDEAAADWKKAVNVFEVGVKADPDSFQHQRGLAEAKRLLQASAK